MIERDEDFYRKTIAVMGHFKRDAIKFVIEGEKVVIFINNVRSKLDLSLSLFYKLSGNEITRMIKESGRVSN